MLIQATVDTFGETIKNWIVLVDFYSEKCMPCQILSKLMPRLAEKFEGQATIATVKTNTEFVLAQQYGIYATPTCIIFKDGAEVERLRGLQPPELYVERLQVWIDAYQGIENPS